MVVRLCNPLPMCFLVLSMLRNWRLDKKNVNPAAELERSIDSVLSQYAEMKKKFDAMAQELKSAKDDFTSAQEQQAEVADLYAQLSEMSDKCKNSECLSCWYLRSVWDFKKTSTLDNFI